MLHLLDDFFFQKLGNYLFDHPPPDGMNVASLLITVTVTVTVLNVFSENFWNLLFGESLAVCCICLLH